MHVWKSPAITHRRTVEKGKDLRELAAMERIPLRMAKEPVHMIVEMFAIVGSVVFLAVAPKMKSP